MANRPLDERSEVVAEEFMNTDQADRERITKLGTKPDEEQRRNLKDPAKKSERIRQKSPMKKLGSGKLL
ncbi:hypothetical protein L484_014438 [Morus notabilis]|uniref:Uncharacterized protein n=1 Tax=Morus notabilis TaxID=981085 RepID=W9QJE8_9ROSA|nr:hypothetical protein L484_014438 [Morus notabilis]